MPSSPSSFAYSPFSPSRCCSVLLMLVSVRIVPREGSKIDLSEEDRQDTKHECQRGSVFVPTKNWGSESWLCPSFPPCLVSNLASCVSRLPRHISPFIKVKPEKEGGIGIGTEGGKEGVCTEKGRKEGGERERGRPRKSRYSQFGVSRPTARPARPRRWIDASCLWIGSPWMSRQIIHSISAASPLLSLPSYLPPSLPWRTSV